MLHNVTKLLKISTWQNNMHIITHVSMCPHPSILLSPAIHQLLPPFINPSTHITTHPHSHVPIHPSHPDKQEQDIEHLLLVRPLSWADPTSSCLLPPDVSRRCWDLVQQSPVCLWPADPWRCSGAKKMECYPPGHFLLKKSATATDQTIICNSTPFNSSSRYNIYVHIICNTDNIDMFELTSMVTIHLYVG